ncbi:MAG: hypothetical protein FJY10_07255 [Bacteroidetes bacterium]|nr:hypothetical protein [Bacteroidota bacterium]
MVLIFLFVVCLSGVLLVYAALFWYYFHFHPFHINITFSEYIIPFVITLLVTLICIRPAYISHFGDFIKNRKLMDLLVFLAGCGILIPLFFSIQYMKVFSPRIVEVGTPSCIRKERPSRYYRIMNYFIDHGHMVHARTSNTAGKYSEYMRLNLFYAAPLKDYREDKTFGSSYNVWTGMHFGRTNSRRAINPKIVGFDEFERLSLPTFKSFNQAKEDMFYIPDPSGFRDGFEKALKENGMLDHGTIPPLILLPVADMIANQQRTRLIWVLGTVAGSIILGWLTIFLLNYLRGR